MDLKQTVIGIELGSTRIKGVLLDRNHRILCQGFYDWENQFENGVWTYSLDAIHEGTQACFASLSKAFFEQYGEKLTTTGMIGISGMMHGYLPFDKNGTLLTPFRTWRNTMTQKACDVLNEKLNFNIPQRWSVAHLYQAILNGESHVGQIDYFTTLSGYIHYRLTGRHVLGIDDASGMFPIDSSIKSYDKERVKLFNELIDGIVPWKLEYVLPKVLVAGDEAGYLTEAGAKFLDPTGTLQSGIPLCPPEGDGGTGMVATNAVRNNTGNVSAGTSIFAMIVTDKRLKMHREMDMVTTPAGLPVAMIHCNNCTGDINAWVDLMAEAITLYTGETVNKGELFTKLFRASLEADPDYGKMVSFNYLSGEEMTKLDAGRPLFVRMPDSKMTLPNFMKTQIVGAIATLAVGMCILTVEEGVKIDKMMAHGGIFKTAGVCQRYLANAIGAPVAVSRFAGEGGPFGMALLAAFALHRQDHETLEDYLDHRVFGKVDEQVITPSAEEAQSMRSFLDQYMKALPIETCAVNAL